MRACSRRYQVDSLAEVGIQVAQGEVQLRQEGFVLGGGFEVRLVDQSQHEDGVVAGGLPEVTVQTAEEFDGAVVPCPAQVVG